MRIGIDACCWSNRRGFGRFTRELITHLIAGHPDHEFLLVVDRLTAAQAQFPAGAAIEVVDTREQPSRAASAQGSRSPLDLWRLSRAVARQRLDAFFFPAVYSFYPLTRRLPTAITLHDTIAENHPDLTFPGRRSFLYWKVKTWLALRQADCLVTVSESARSQIMAKFGIPEGTIHVIPEGPSPAFGTVDDRSKIGPILDHYRLPRGCPLILYVGGISPHKNLEGLLRSLTTIDRHLRAPWHVALVGDHAADGFFSCYQELLVLRRELDLERRVTFTGYVPDGHLVALYNAATVVVLPSFDEGFGLPAVEAMACGVPVAASRRGSLPEVLGPAGIYFDPNDHDDMAAAIVRILDYPPLRARLRIEGLRRAESYSWQVAARRIVGLFEEMVHGRSQVA